VEAKIAVAILREVLTVREVALELRCSLPHVYNVINGKVKNVPRLPAIAVGRRKLIQRDTLEDWKKSNEHGDDDVMIPPTKIDAVRRMEEDLYA
jgi:excisionase family DNA binding protein